MSGGTHSSVDLGQVYRDTRLRLSDLARHLGTDELALAVPTCPGWTVKDVMAHLVGLATDLVDGAPYTVGSEEGNRMEIAQRVERSIDDLLAEWERSAAILEAKISQGPDRLYYRLITDLATHEQDIRSAVHRPGGRDSSGIRVALETYITLFQRRIERANLPMLLLQANGEEWMMGSGEPATTLTAPPFELFRALSGRRSVRQIATLRWEGQPEPYLDIFGAFPLAQTDIKE